MRFYIFGNDKPKINVRPKKAIYYSEYFNEAIKNFDHYVAGIKNKNIWLVVDFECRKQSFWGSGLNDDHFSKLPFFVIAEYHYDNHSFSCARRDTTTVFRSGFNHEFDNNVKAMREFLYFYNNNDYAKWSVTYQVGERLFVREIINTNDLKDSKVRKVRKFRLGEELWEKVPLSRTFTEFVDCKIFPEPQQNGPTIEVMKFAKNG